ncbi:MAG: hypothetical protein R2909_10845 [Gemmatimonadales bacterium]
MTAEPLLGRSTVEWSPRRWRGAADHLRDWPRPRAGRLEVAFNWDRVPLYNVIVRIPGSDLADEWVVRGSHRDGWVNGATDPLSGLIAEMEELRGTSRSSTRAGSRDGPSSTPRGTERAGA